MPKYLDPRNDLVFKKVFGDNPPILIDFLNALLPLAAPIESIEYLSPEQAPEIPEFKYTIVDVKCVDQTGDQFIVEMQLDWVNHFHQRVLYNACKAYTRQLEKGESYNKLRRVFALSLINDVFMRDSPEYYHHYALRHATLPEKKMEGLEFVFIELPKFKPTGSTAHSELWLRFMTEINEDADAAPIELAQTPPFDSALHLAATAAYNQNELDWYDKLEDSYRLHLTMVEDAHIKGIDEGKTETARAMKAEGLSIELIAKITGLSPEIIAEL